MFPQQNNMHNQAQIEHLQTIIDAQLQIGLETLNQHIENYLMTYPNNEGDLLRQSRREATQRLREQLTESANVLNQDLQQITDLPAPEAYIRAQIELTLGRLSLPLFIDNLVLLMPNNEEAAVADERAFLPLAAARIQEVQTSHPSLADEEPQHTSLRTLRNT